MAKPYTAIPLPLPIAVIRRFDQLYGKTKLYGPPFFIQEVIELKKWADRPLDDISQYESDDPDWKDVWDYDVETKRKQQELVAKCETEGFKFIVGKWNEGTEETILSGTYQALFKDKEAAEDYIEEYLTNAIWQKVLAEFYPETE